MIAKVSVIDMYAQVSGPNSTKPIDASPMHAVVFNSLTSIHTVSKQNNFNGKNSKKISVAIIVNNVRKRTREMQNH